MKKRILLFVTLTFLFSHFANAEGLLTYKPPVGIGTPKAVFGGGTRSLNLPKIQVLAPKERALTSKSQPVLYWYLPEVTSKPITFKLLQNEEVIVEKEIIVSSKGLQRIWLADFSQTLNAEKEYQWSVTLDNQESSATVIFQTSTLILSNVQQQAEAGYWYDALQNLIESHSPLANDLLKQIGLNMSLL